MALARRACPPLMAVVAAALLTLTSAAADAAATRYLRVTGDATGGGVATITIESFNKPDITGPRSGGGGPTPAATSVVTCTIAGPIGKTSVAAALVDSLNAQLSGDYTASIHGSFPYVVQLDYAPVGSFEFTSIVETIPGSTIVEVDAGGIPTLAEWGLIALIGLLVTMGVVALRRRTGGGLTPA